MADTSKAPSGPAKFEADPSKDPPKVEAKTEKAAPEKPEAKHVGADDDIPTDANLIQLSTSALNKRLDRFSKKQLEEHFGTSDVGQIKADLAELKESRAAKEAARQAALTREEKLSEERDKEKKRADAAEQKLVQAEERQAFAKYDDGATGALKEAGILPKYVKLAMHELKDHVNSLDEDDAALKKPEKLFNEWAKAFVKDHPELVVKEEAPPAPKKVPLTTGGDSKEKPAKVAIDLTQKDPRPGRPNSMTKAEFAQHKKAMGLS